MARKTPAQIKAYFETGDIPTASQFSDFIDNSVPTCKRYKALMTQSGTAAPVATVLENTVGVIVWSRASEGSYVGTLTGSFLELKTFIHEKVRNKVIDEAARIEITRLSDDEISIKTASDELGTLSDDQLTYTPILIEVYD